MIYILLLLLLIIAGSFYLMAHQNALSPTVIVCGVFIISTSFACVNISNWKFTLDPTTVLVIIMGILAFGAGEIIVNLYFSKKILKMSRTTKRIDTYERIELSNTTLVIVIFALLIMVCYYAYKTYQLALMGGSPGDTNLILHYARKALLESIGSVGRIAGHFFLIAKAIDFVLILIFLNNAILCRCKLRDFTLLLPTIIYFVFMTLTTGRDQFIYWIVSLLTIGCVCIQIKLRWKPKSTAVIVALAILSFILLLTFFTLAGYLTGKSQSKRAFDMISIYAGISIPSLDAYLLYPAAETGLIGDHTLISIYATLRTIGFKSLPIPYPHYEFVDFNGTTGNVYTALRRYIQDYTFLGMLILMFMLGVLYNIFFTIVKRQNKAGLSLLLYSAFCYPLFMMSIDELFLMSVIGTSTVYITMYLCFFYYIFVYRYRNGGMNCLRKKVPI